VIRFDNAAFEGNLWGDGNPPDKGSPVMEDLRQHPRSSRAIRRSGMPSRVEDSARFTHRRGVEICYAKPRHARRRGGGVLRMEADWGAGYLMNVRAGVAGTKQHPQTPEASMAKARRFFRVASDGTLRRSKWQAPQLFRGDPAGEWARTDKILDISRDAADSAAGCCPAVGGAFVAERKLAPSVVSQ